MTRTDGTLRWMLSAACVDEDPELFFPPGQTRRSVQQTNEARAVCGTCEVRSPCLQLALETNAQYGVWGGLSPYELTELQRRRYRLHRSRRLELNSSRPDAYEVGCS